MKDEQIIIKQILEGDREAFTILVDRYKDRIYALTLTKVRDPAVGEDLVQNAFIEAYKNLRYLKDYKNFSGWLWGITTNLCHKWNRKTHRQSDRIDVYQDEVRHQNPMDNQTPETILLEKELRQSVLQAIENLNDDQREVVILQYMEDMSYKEMSSMLDMPESTIQGRLRTARAQLRNDLLPLVTDVLKALKPNSAFTRDVMMALPLLDSTEATRAVSSDSSSGFNLLTKSMVILIATTAFLYWGLLTGRQNEAWTVQSTAPDTIAWSPGTDVSEGNWIQQGFKVHTEQLNQLYQKRLTINPFLRGVLTVRLSVDNDGHVKRVILINETTGDQLFSQQVIRALKQWQFNLPPDLTGREVVVTMPFIPHLSGE